MQEREPEDLKITQVISVTELSTTQQEILWKAVQYTMHTSLYQYKKAVPVKPSRQIVFSQPGYIEYAHIVCDDTDRWDDLKRADFPVISFKPSDFCAKLPEGIKSLSESEKEELILQLKADGISYEENKFSVPGYLESLYEGREDLIVPKILMKLALRTNTEDPSENLSDSPVSSDNKLPPIYVVADYDDGVENIICMTTCEEDMENIYDLYPFHADIRRLYEVDQGMTEYGMSRSGRPDWHRGCTNPKYERRYGWWY